MYEYAPTNRQSLYSRVVYYSTCLHYFCFGFSHFPELSDILYSSPINQQALLYHIMFSSSFSCLYGSMLRYFCIPIFLSLYTLCFLILTIFLVPLFFLSLKSVSLASPYLYIFPCISIFLNFDITLNIHALINLYSCIYPSHCFHVSLLLVSFTSQNKKWKIAF